MPPKTRSAPSRSASAAPKKLYGITEARLFPKPLRQLSRNTSRGYDIIDFAQVIGQPLLPWQQWAVIHAFEIGKDGTYRFRIVVIMVARQNGKSHLMRIITLWRMLYDADCQLILGTAQDLAQASNQLKLTLRTVKNTPSLRKRLAYERHVNGQEAFGFSNGAEYIVRSANEDAGRGFSADGLIIDELRTHKDRRAWSALYYTTMARPNPMTVCLSNAGDDRSVVLNQLRDAALSGRDDSIGLFEWSAEDGCDLGDIRAWRQANPGMGHAVSEAAIRTASVAEKPSVFRTEVLCQAVSQLDGAIDLAAWDDCADPAGTLTSKRDRIAACADVALDGTHVTLAVAAKLPDGRAQLEIAGAWTNTTEARAELPALLDKIRPAALGWYPSGPAGALRPILAGRPNAEELGGTTATAACQGLADLAQSRGILHNADPLLDTQVKNAQKIASGDAWRFARRSNDDDNVPHVDACYAAAGAVHLALTMPEPRRSRIRMLG